MPLDELERWLQARAERHPVATSLPMLDGYVAAIVAGPVSISPLDWICPLLAIDADAFNHGGTPEFAAISAVALRHNDISNVLSTAPEAVRADPCRASRMATSMRVPGARDSTPPCSCDYRLGRRCSTPATSTTACCCPSCCIVVDDQGRPLLGPPRKGRETEEFLRNAHTDIPAVVEAMRQYWMPTRYARAG